MQYPAIFRLLTTVVGDPRNWMETTDVLLGNMFKPYCGNVLFWQRSFGSGSKFPKRRVEFNESEQQQV